MHKGKQAKGERENRYMIRVMVMRLKGKRGACSAVPLALARENQRPKVIRLQKAWMHELVATLCTEM
jgi:hypothetical protein